jgi:hypothetical protein
MRNSVYPGWSKCDSIPNGLVYQHFASSRSAA